MQIANSAMTEVFLDAPYAYNWGDERDKPRLLRFEQKDGAVAEVEVDEMLRLCVSSQWLRGSWCR